MSSIITEEQAQLLLEKYGELILLQEILEQEAVDRGDRAYMTHYTSRRKAQEAKDVLAKEVPDSVLVDLSSFSGGFSRQTFELLIRSVGVDEWGEPLARAKLTKAGWLVTGHGVSDPVCVPSVADAVFLIEAAKQIDLGKENGT